jgi:hypothetical protein
MVDGEEEVNGQLVNRGRARKVWIILRHYQ